MSAGTGRGGAGRLGRARVAGRSTTRSARSTSSIAAVSGPPASSSAGSPSGIRGSSRASGEAGHEIGSHGQWHRRVYELEPDEFTRDLRLANASLVAAGAPRPTQFRAPEWSINGRAPWALERLAAEGFTVDSSRAPLRVVGDPMYPETPHVIATPYGPIVEVPPAVERRLGQRTPFGGGWGLRLARPGRVVREIARRNARGEPVTCWIHPWELDPDPPRMTFPAGVAFAHYFRLSGWMDRLETILRGAPFGTMSEMLAQLPSPPSPS